MKKQILTILLSLLALAVFADAPVVNIVSVIPSTGKVTITYDLIADSYCDVSLVISDDEGATYQYYPTAVNGDIGAQVNAGTNNQIVWHPAADEMTAGTNYKAKVIARDNPTITDESYQSFVKVTGGILDISTYNNPNTITVSSFYIDKFEITQGEYKAVMGNNISTNLGEGSDYPIYKVSWFNAIEYCNRRSLQEGYTPCYSYSTFGTNPDDWEPSDWNKTNANHSNVSWNMQANGYRLPALNEWIFAAKGGMTPSYTGLQNGWSGTDQVAELPNYAWYSEDTIITTTTKTVGTKYPNELGLYDMTGNVREWCFSTPNNNTNKYYARGGSYKTASSGCAIKNDASYDPTANWDDPCTGIRLFRSVPAPSPQTNY